jgi:hypothetical protein
MEALGAEVFDGDGDGDGEVLQREKERERKFTRGHVPRDDGLVSPTTL